MTNVEKILAGADSTGNYDLDLDFDNHEVETLLREDVVCPRDFGCARASDLLIDGVLDYDRYPFDDFPPYEQIRQLEHGAVTPEDFLRQADFDLFDGDEWLYLLAVLPLTWKLPVPWARLRAQGTLRSWMELLTAHPEYAPCADWEKLARQEIPEKFLRLREAARPPCRGRAAEFIPEDELEEAICRRDPVGIIRLTAEGGRLRRPEVLMQEAFLALPLRTAAVVIGGAMSPALRAAARDRLTRIEPDSEVLYLLNDVEMIPQSVPSAAEEVLREAVRAGDDREIIRLVRQNHICFRGLSERILEEFVTAMRNLGPHSAVLLLNEGWHYASLPGLLRFLVRECEEATVLNDMDYRERLKFTNMLLHLLQGEITPDDDELIALDWFPMGGSIENGTEQCGAVYGYSYYFDPRHLYRPRLS